MKWRRKRQLLIALFVLGPIVLVLSFWWFYSRPEATCFDGVRNQGERGVDCGGVCGNICQEDIPNPGVSWARTFQISGDVYNAVAKIDVPGSGLSADNVEYVFRLYDKDSVLISEERNRLNIPPSSTIALFDPSIRVGTRAPVRATLEFPHDVVWEKSREGSVDFSIVQSPQISADNIGAEVRVFVGHNAGRILEDVLLALVLFDSDGNAIHASQTFLEEFNSGETESLVFTWPELDISLIESVSIFPISYNFE